MSVVHTMGWNSVMWNTWVYFVMAQLWRLLLHISVCEWIRMHSDLECLDIFLVLCSTFWVWKLVSGARRLRMDSGNVVNMATFKPNGQKRLCGLNMNSKSQTWMEEKLPSEGTTLCWVVEAARWCMGAYYEGVRSSQLYLLLPSSPLPHLLLSM